MPKRKISTAVFSLGVDVSGGAWHWIGGERRKKVRGFDDSVWFQVEPARPPDKCVIVSSVVVPRRTQRYTAG